MVSEQGFSAAIAMFAIFSMFVGLGTSGMEDGTSYLLVDSFLLVLASIYLCLAAMKSGENIRQIVKIAAYSNEIHERGNAGLHWEEFMHELDDGRTLYGSGFMQWFYNKEYAALALLAIAAYIVNIYAFAARIGCDFLSFIFDHRAMVLFAVSISILLLFVTAFQSSAKKNYVEYGEKCGKQAQGFRERLEPGAAASGDDAGAMEAGDDS